MPRRTEPPRRSCSVELGRDSKPRDCGRGAGEGAGKRLSRSLGVSSIKLGLSIRHCSAVWGLSWSDTDAEEGDGLRGELLGRVGNVVVRETGLDVAGRGASAGLGGSLRGVNPIKWG